jgi:hypothetical protein
MKNSHILIRSLLIACLTTVACFAQPKSDPASTIQPADTLAGVAEAPRHVNKPGKLRLRVRLAGLSFDTHSSPGPYTVPFIADKVFDLPKKPVDASRIFEGKSFIDFLPEITIKWGFHGGVGYLQKKLIDDAELDSVSAWHFIDTASNKIPTTVQAFVNGEEIAMQGRLGVIVERY